MTAGASDGGGGVQRQRQLTVAAVAGTANCVDETGPRQRKVVRVNDNDGRRQRQQRLAVLARATNGSGGGG